MLKRPAIPHRAPYVDRSPPEVHTRRRRLRACYECDWLCALPPLTAGEKATCPRCHHTLARRHHHPAQRSMALAMAALVALMVAVSFPFISFSVSGVSNSIELPQTATALISFHQPVVAVVVILTIVVLPACYLLAVMWLQLGLMRYRPLPFSRDIARALAHLTPWMMADVFIIGALVSLIKIAGLAQVSLGLSFWAFCAFAFLLLLTSQSLDADWLWFSLDHEPLAPQGAQTGAPAAAQQLTGCPTCGLVNRLAKTQKTRCRRCGEHLHARRPHSLQRTWALLAAAAVMYIPANFYPIMNVTNLGETSSSTIISGVVELYQSGSWPVALVIFIASVIVPVGKLFALGWLCLVARRSHRLNAHSRTVLYRVTEFIGRWSMVDVFVVAILVALIRAGTLMSITPGPAELAFGAVVVLTMLAAMSFDPRLIWDAPLPRKVPSHTKASQGSADG
ncbi:paraquat-inducible protein A [Halomonas cibimaris]